MKPVHVLCICLMLAGTLLLAQSGSIGIANEVNRLPVDSELRSGVPQASQGTPSALPHSGRSHRRQATPQVQNWPLESLYLFLSGSDGQNPIGGLIFDAAGNLYGATQFGGVGSCTDLDLGCGTAFELSPNGNGGWAETILYRFQNGNDGAEPSAGLILDKSGNLYGTTAGGGSGGFGGEGVGGTAFELSPNGDGGWTEKILYNFCSVEGCADGQQPQGLIFDESGNLYGTTDNGGQPGCSRGLAPCGTVFELSPNGNGGWTETVIYTFALNGSAGSSPSPGLIFDKSGNLYGTASEDGTGTNCDGCGTAFELSPSGSGSWTETTIYNFQGGSDGNYPQAGLVFDQLGNLYGTTQRGGGGSCYSDGCGAAFELSPNGSGDWTETTLHDFDGLDGAYPGAGLAFDKNGNLYGTTFQGGTLEACSCGNVFELSPNGSGGWTETVLYMFLGGGDGAEPSSGVIFDQTGNLYGTTFKGGTGAIGCIPGCGVAFEVFRAPLATFSPTSLSSGNQTVGISSSPQTTSLTNSGNLPLTITSIQITGADISDFSQTNNCPSSMPPNTSCNINVTFTPAAAGNRSAVVSVTDNASGSPQTVPLSGTGQGFSLVLSSPSTVTVAPGQAANYTVTVAPGGAFNQQVAFTCSGAPAQSSCAVSPSSVTLNGSSSVPVTVTVTTAGASTSVAPASVQSPGGDRVALWLAFSGLSGLVLLGSRPRKRHGRRGVALSCLLFIVMMLSACGSGGSTGGSGGSATPAGTYNLTVVGTFVSGSANLVQSAKLTLVVQ